MAKCGGIVSQQQIVMGKVVTDRVFKRQLDMLQVGVRCDIDSEPCAGEVTSIIKADKMFDHRCFGTFRQIQMMSVMGSVDLFTCHAPVICINSNGFAGR